MKIGIVGNYGNDNQGDEAILEGILTQLEEAFPIQRENVIVFSNNPEQTKRKFRVQAENLYIKKNSAVSSFIATVNKNKQVIKQLDILLIGGGGILMDLYRNGLIIFGMYGWLAKRSKVPTVIYGAGAGPINTILGKKILTYLVSNAELVTVRDVESKQLLETLTKKNTIHVIADPALFLRTPDKDKNVDSDTFSIGVTAVPFFHPSYWPSEDLTKYNDYIDGMARNLDQLVERIPNSVVRFFSTKHPHDTNVTKDIKERMVHKDKCTILDKRMEQDEMLQLINEQDLIVGTRLHSLILAIVAHTPVMAVAYHPKVEHFMDSLNLIHSVVPIYHINKEADILSKIYDIMEMNDELSNKYMESKLDEVRNKYPLGMDLIKQTNVIQHKGN